MSASLVAATIVAVTALHTFGLALIGLFGDVAATSPEPLDRVAAVVEDEPIFLGGARRARDVAARSL